MDKQQLQAAEKGDAESQFNLGVMYENGVDDNHYPVEGNRLEAMRWLLAAAEQGLPRAQFKLAEMYADGLDTPGTYVRACGWFLLAMTNLHGAHLQKAQSGYERASLHLTLAQIANARRFAQSWKLKQANEAGHPGLTRKIPTSLTRPQPEIARAGSLSARPLTSSLKD
jgi:TPR repeat protein